MNLCNSHIKEKVQCSNCGATNMLPFSDYATMDCKVSVEYVEAIGTCWKCKVFFSQKRKRKPEEFLRLN